MKPKKSNPIVLTLAWLALSTLSPQLSTAFAQGTAFTYQGRLNANGGPANGIYDFQFMVYDALSGGSPVAGPLSTNAVRGSGGLSPASATEVQTGAWRICIDGTQRKEMRLL